MKRSGRQRLDAIPAAIANGEEFRSRVAAAAGDAVKCADLMAEAIAMDRAARGLEIVGQDGRQTFSFERMIACHCLDAARLQYLDARGSNSGVKAGQNGI